MTKQNHISRVWDIIEKARVGMLTTQFGCGMRARPLEPPVDGDAGLIWFVIDVRGAKEDEIEVAHDSGSSSSMRMVALISPSPAALP